MFRIPARDQRDGCGGVRELFVQLELVPAHPSLILTEAVANGESGQLQLFEPASRPRRQPTGLALRCRRRPAVSADQAAHPHPGRLCRLRQTLLLLLHNRWVQCLLERRLAEQPAGPFLAHLHQLQLNRRIEPVAFI